MTISYKDIPPLAAYIDRIGAEQLNFRRFIVRTFKGDHYYVERCLIRLGADGEVTVANKEFAPTKEEAAAIKGALLSVSWPKAINATAANLKVLKKKLGGNAMLYGFYDRASGEVIMVQERAEIEGKKAYIPWTFWSDGEWRKMEPEQALPFWKPSERTGKRRIMVHEGAKTAHIIHTLVSDKEKLAAHPWGDQLKDYEHWGMIGGALAPHRSDYGELVLEKPLEVIYVCDNDYPGKAALREVSRAYGHALKGIMFDERWPASWDMADPMPKTLFSSSGRWLGPELKKLTQLATWATETVPSPDGKGKGVTVVRREFTEEWFHCVVPEVFVHRDWSSVILTSSEFNNRVRPFSDVDDTARLVKTDAASKSAVLKYQPAIKIGIYSDETGARFINTHSPSPIKAEKGDPTPFLEFMSRLVPAEEDRRELLRWCATLIARPDTKMLYGVLLISEKQGVGKGTLGEKILGPLVGEANVSSPSESDIVDSAFNYWAAHKRLAVVHEIYAGHSAKAYNKLKSVITDRYITVSKKYQANYDIENWIHIFACSNSMRAIQLSIDDRRWFVPKITEEKIGAPYWIELNEWLIEHGGLGIIRWWAHEWLKKNAPVARGDAAPWSTAKHEVIEEGYSPGMILVSRVLDYLKAHILQDQTEGKAVFLLDVDLVQVIKDYVYEGRPNDRLERPATIRKVARASGWEVGEIRGQVGSWGTSAMGARIISLDPEVAKMVPSELAKLGRPLDVAALAKRMLENARM